MSITDEHADWFSHEFNLVLANVERIIRGKTDQIATALVCLFAEGHLLLEDVPGTGKTTLAKAMANSMESTWRRIQFTPDLLPSDVTGGMIYDQSHGTFEFRPGPGVRQRGAGRRDQPCFAEDPGGDARGDGGTPRHRRRRGAPGPSAVRGDRHAEPDRAGGHVPPSRGAARPLPVADRDRLPGPRRRGRCRPSGDARRGPRGSHAR